MHICLDLETTRFFAEPEIAKLPRDQQIAVMARHFGVAWTYDSDGGWRCWWPGDVGGLWQTLRGNTVVGWNTARFDMPLVLHAANVPEDERGDWGNADLFALISARTDRWYSLREVAEVNLGQGKSSDGQQAARWLQSGDPALRQRAAEYCRQDVQLVLDLLAHGATHGLLLPPRNTRRPQTPETYRLRLGDIGGPWQLENAETGLTIDKGARWDGS